jgi:hypothetical protein
MVQSVTKRKKKRKRRIGRVGMLRVLCMAMLDGLTAGSLMALSSPLPLEVRSEGR